MVEELKIRIHDNNTVERILVERGAKFSHELHVVDTYFQQPKREVLKITEDETGNFLVNLKSRDGKFQIVKYEKIENVAETKAKLQQKLGVKDILKKKRHFFNFKQYVINVNIIDRLGEFFDCGGRIYCTEHLS